MSLSMSVKSTCVYLSMCVSTTVYLLPDVNTSVKTWKTYLEKCYRGYRGRWRLCEISRVWHLTTFDGIYFFYLIRVFHSHSPNFSVTWNYTIKSIGVEIAVNIYVLYCVLNWCWKRLQKCTKDFRAYRNLTPQKSFFDNLDSQQIDQMNRQKSFVE